MSYKVAFLKLTMHFEWPLPTTRTNLFAVFMLDQLRQGDKTQ